MALSKLNIKAYIAVNVDFAALKLFCLVFCFVFICFVGLGFFITDVPSLL